MTTFIYSSIGKKAIMSISGLFLIVFLALHVVLNLTALHSRELYETMCEFMDKNILVQIMVPVLASGFIVHIVCSIIIELHNWSSRPVGYLVSTKSRTSSWASKHMFVLGVIVLGFLGLHFYHFWAKMQLQHFLGNEGANPYDLVVHLFSQWQYSVLYIVWLCALYFHLAHGFWSAFHSLGMNNSRWLPRLQFLAKLYAAAVVLAFIFIPVYFWLIVKK